MSVTAMIRLKNSSRVGKSVTEQTFDDGKCLDEGLNSSSNVFLSCELFLHCFRLFDSSTQFLFWFIRLRLFVLDRSVWTREFWFWTGDQLMCDSSATVSFIFIRIWTLSFTLQLSLSLISDFHSFKRLHQHCRTQTAPEQNLTPAVSHSPSVVYILWATRPARYVSCFCQCCGGAACSGTQDDNEAAEREVKQQDRFSRQPPSEATVPSGIFGLIEEPGTRKQTDKHGVRVAAGGDVPVQEGGS